MKKGITLIGVLVAMLAVTSGAFAAPPLPDHVVQPDQGRRRLALRSLAGRPPGAAGQGRDQYSRPAGACWCSRRRRCNRRNRRSWVTRRLRVQPARGARRDPPASAGTKFAPGATRRTTPTRTWVRGTTAWAAAPSLSRLLPRQGRPGWRLPVHVDRERRIQLAGGLGRKWRGRVVPRSHGLEHDHGQAERQFRVDRAGQRQGEPRRHDVVRRLRERHLAAQAGSGCPRSGVGAASSSGVSSDA